MDVKNEHGAGKEKRGMSYGPGFLMPFFLGTHFSIKFPERLLLRSFSPSCAYYALCIFDALSRSPFLAPVHAYKIFPRIWKGCQ